MTLSVSPETKLHTWLPQERLGLCGTISEYQGPLDIELWGLQCGDKVWKGSRTSPTGAEVLLRACLIQGSEDSLGDDWDDLLSRPCVYSGDVAKWGATKAIHAVCGATLAGRRHPKRKWCEGVTTVPKSRGREKGACLDAKPHSFL